ncbi:MAG: RNase P subunit p30 family protein, partial [Haloferacaceae archaeon]
TPDGADDGNRDDGNRDDGSGEGNDRNEGRNDLRDRGATVPDRPYGVDVVRGVELEPGSVSRLGGLVASWRERTVVVIVRGGQSDRNRAALEDPRVDVLSAPFGSPGDADGDVNHVLVKAAVDNDVAIEFDLAPVLRASGGKRVRALKRLRKLRELVEHYRAPFVVSARPDSHLRLRAPRELRALGAQIGLDPGDVSAGLRRWGSIARRNRRRRSDSFIGEGVQRGRHETEP